MIAPGPVVDLLVGCLSALMGGISLAAAVGNWDWFYQLYVARRIESAWGRRCARGYYVVLGLLLIALGVAIAVGYPNR